MEFVGERFLLGSMFDTIHVIFSVACVCVCVCTSVYMYEELDLAILGVIAIFHTHKY